MNNRYINLLLTILVAVLFLRCSGSKKITYIIPDSYPVEKRKELKEECKKGLELYKINCSECHGIFTAGKDKVPDFTNTQIDNYSAKFLRHDPRNHAVTRKMSPEQMNEILMFLRFRKVDKKTR